MTRTLSITDTICPICKTFYDTVEEAIECEREDEIEIDADEDDREFWAEHYAALEQDYQEADDEYLTSLYSVAFERP